MRIPVIFGRQSLVNAVVEIFVVGENNVAANIVELIANQLGAREGGRESRTKPSGVISVDANPPGVSFESIIIHDGPFCTLDKYSFGVCCSLSAY